MPIFSLCFTLLSLRLSDLRSFLDLHSFSGVGSDGGSGVGCVIKIRLAELT